jgi:hypothetical protein
METAKNYQSKIMEVNMLLSKNTLLKDYKLKSFAGGWHIVLAVFMAGFMLSIINPGSVQAQRKSEHKKFLGGWIETKESGPSEKRAVFKIMKTKDGSLAGYTKSPDRGFFGEIPISGVSIRGDSLFLDIKKLNARFRGQINGSNSKIKGHWISGDRSADFTLVRLTKARKESLPEPPEAKRPEANPEDVSSPEAIVKAFHETLSGEKGEKRDWDRFRSLFLPDARIVATTRAGDAPGRQTWTANEYIKEIGKGVDKMKFQIKQLHSEQERFGDIAHVFSTFKESGTPIDKPFQRGLNSYQLWYNGERWWIYSMLWHGEREDTQIPSKYLGK